MKKWRFGLVMPHIPSVRENEEVYKSEVVCVSLAEKVWMLEDAIEM